MGFWKVLGYATGGAVVGVGAVAAAPFTGGGSLLGAATLATSLAGAAGVATATGAGVAVAGGVAGKVIADMEEEEKASERRAGERKATAKYNQKVKKLDSALEVACGKLSDDKSYFQLLISLVAIGMATANADGEVSREELEELEEFTAGIAHSHLPEHVKKTIVELKKNPPTFNTAMEHVNKLGNNIDLKLFESVIEVISSSDGYVSKEEKALLSAFSVI